MPKLQNSFLALSDLTMDDQLSVSFPFATLTDNPLKDSPPLSSPALSHRPTDVQLNIPRPTHDDESNGGTDATRS